MRLVVFGFDAMIALLSLSLVRGAKILIQLTVAVKLYNESHENDASPFSITTNSDQDIVLCFHKSQQFWAKRKKGIKFVEKYAIKKIKSIIFTVFNWITRIRQIVEVRVEDQFLMTLCSSCWIVHNLSIRNWWQ